MNRVEVLRLRHAHKARQNLLHGLKFAETAREIVERMCDSRDEHARRVKASQGRITHTNWTLIKKNK